jgi:hypothetical protein
MPQRNGKVEQKFQIPYGRICAMMNDFGIEGEFCNGLWTECVATSMFYENIIITLIRNE